MTSTLGGNKSLSKIRDSLKDKLESYKLLTALQILDNKERVLEMYSSE